MQNGYYYAVVKEVNVECYNPPSDAQVSGSKAYYYTSTAGLESDVAIGDNSTILGSIYASGEKPDYNPSASAGSGSKPTQTPQTVPGISGGGTQQLGGQQGSSGGSAASSAAGNSPTGASGFTQGGESKASALVAGPVIALLGFFVAALML